MNLFCRSLVIMPRNVWGWFSEGQRAMYNEFARKARDGDTILEIGALFGKSTCYLAQKLKAAGKKVTITVVDPWQLETLTSSNKARTLFKTKLCATATPYQCFQTNLRQAGVANKIEALQMTSDAAFEQFKRDGRTFQFIMIDGNHTYAQVKRDIQNALPCWDTRSGSILAGDDYNGGGGVAKAVQEVLGKRVRFNTNKKTAQWFVARP